MCEWGDWGSGREVASVGIGGEGESKGIWNCEMRSKNEKLFNYGSRVEHSF